jgi:hypothetical protein
VGPCLHGTVPSQVEDGETASSMEGNWNIFEKQSRTAVKGGPPDCGLVAVLTTSHSKNVSC